MPRLLALGEPMLDEAVCGRISTCQDHCPKLLRTERIRTPGGAAGAARQLAHSGADVYLCGPTGGMGCDVPYTWNRDYEFVEGKVPVKRRFLCEQGVIRFREDVEEEGYGIKEQSLMGLRHLALQAVKNGRWDGVLISDYAKGFLTENLIREVCRFCEGEKIPVVADLKRAPSVGLGAVLKCNADYARQWGVSVLLHSPASVVTQGPHQPTISSSEGLEPIHSQVVRPVRCVSHVGAGDCFAAWLLLGLVEKLPLGEACRRAHAAGRVYVQHAFGRPPFPHEIGLDLDPVGGKVLRAQDLAGIRESHPGRIVFAPGVWRLLHPGHVHLLEWAKRQGDILVVGVNDDLSAFRQKLKNYVMPLEHRVAMLAALDSVDWVVPFSEDTPVEVIKMLKPDLMAKGHDRAGEEIPGSELCPTVISPEGSYSLHSTDLVAAIKSA